MYTAMADELIKIAQNKGLSPFTQGRRGRRPVRVHNAVKADRYVHPEDEEKENNKGELVREYGGGMNDA